jgi:hypothetical protein
VKDPHIENHRELKRWHETLAKGTVVLIEEGHAEPREVEIVIGQTVFFAVTKTSGVSITDERLLWRTTTHGDADPEQSKARQDPET